MTRCPNCQTMVNPMRLLFAGGRRNPYRCPKCSRRYQRTALTGVVFYPLLACAFVLLRHWLGLSVFAIVMPALATAILLDWLVFPWKVVESTVYPSDEPNADTTPRRLS